MKDYPFNPDQLFSFSASAPYFNKDNTLYNKLNELKTQLNFPAIGDDVGELLSFLVQIHRPKIIFEMGSGYGHSSFWYTRYESKFISKIYLTEKRDDLMEHFNSLPWSDEHRDKCHYHQGDAWDLLESVQDIDLLLIDGVKASYLDFFKAISNRLNKGALIVVDNSYWRGSFLDESIKKNTALKIKEFHEFFKSNEQYQATFIPYIDGVTLIRKLL